MSDDDTSATQVLWWLDVSINDDFGELNLISATGSCYVNGEFTDLSLEGPMLEWVLDHLGESPDPSNIELVRFHCMPEPEFNTED